jgi:hypothetical protein
MNNVQILQLHHLNNILRSSYIDPLRMLNNFLKYILYASKVFQNEILLFFRQVVNVYYTLFILINHRKVYILGSELEVNSQFKYLGLS